MGIEVKRFNDIDKSRFTTSLTSHSDFSFHKLKKPSNIIPPAFLFTIFTPLCIGLITNVSLKINQKLICYMRMEMCMH